MCNQVSSATTPTGQELAHLSRGAESARGNGGIT